MFTAPASDKTQYAFHRLFYAQVDSQVNSLSPVQVNSLSHRTVQVTYLETARPRSYD